MSIRGRLVREMHLTRTWHLWGVLLASLFLLWAPGRAQESNLDTVFTSTLQAYQEHKLTAQQKDKILAELRQLQEELQESANIARIAERTFQTNKADLSKNAQAAAAKKVQEIKEHTQLSKEQANHYAQALLQNTLDGKDTDKAKYITNKNAQAFSTAKDLQQIVNDPNYRSWSSHFFKVAGQTATNIKEQLSPHEIKQLLRKGHSDEHPVIKKSLDTVLGKDAARVLIDGSRDDLKRALKKYGKTLWQQMTFTNQPIGSVKEITKQLAEEEKVLTKQESKESSWKSWLSSDSPAARQTKAALIYLAALQATLKEEGQAAVAAVSKNMQDLYNTIQEWRSPTIEQIEMLDFIYQETIRNMEEDFMEKADYAIEAFGRMGDELDRQLTKAGQKLKKAHNNQIELLSDFYAQYYPLWLDDYLAQAEALGLEGFAEELWKAAQDKTGKAKRALIAKIKSAGKKVFPSLGNGDNETFIISLIHGQGGMEVLRAMYAARNEACWERWIRLAVPQAKQILYPQVLEKNRQLSCKVHFNDLGKDFKELLKYDTNGENLLGILGINCQSPEREARFCAIENVLQEKIEKERPTGTFGRWADKILNTVNPGPLQQLVETLPKSFAEVCGVKIACPDPQFTQNRAIIQRRPGFNDKIKLDSGPRSEGKGVQK